MINGDSWTHRYTFTSQNGVWGAERNRCQQRGSICRGRPSGRKESQSKIRFALSALKVRGSNSPSFYGISKS